ncbi:MAG: iron transporter permease [Candidatus Eremiobacteraeota bacterium]|nr:iron transporter permease [Candidatus Eremiobacteraeota bacterium]
MTRSATVSLLAAALVAAAAVSVTIGAVHVSGSDALGALRHGEGVGAYVVRELRAPRIAAGILVGCSLGTAGALLQTALRNPLADPYLMGASGGAGLAVALAILAGAPASLYTLAAFGGAIAATSVSLAVARGAGTSSQHRLILVGVGVSSLCAALTTLAILMAPHAGMSLSILSWLGGSLTGHGWPDVRWATLTAAAGLALTLAVAPSLDAMRLGRERAAGVGVDVMRTQFVVVVASSLLAAGAVSVSGVIGFVGLLVPHAARRLVGGSVPWVAAASAPLGGLVVVLADLVARGAAPPIELPVGILLSIVGVPAFLAIVGRTTRIA